MTDSQKNMTEEEVLSKFTALLCFKDPRYAMSFVRDFIDSQEVLVEAWVRADGRMRQTVADYIESFITYLEPELEK